MDNDSASHARVRDLTDTCSGLGISAEKGMLCRLAVEVGACTKVYKHCGSAVFTRQQAASSW